MKTARVTRPPFADFSSIAVREMMKWIPEHAMWADRMQQVLYAAGRELLVELLKHYENAQTRAGFSYDFGWMWRELGLEHLRK